MPSPASQPLANPSREKKNQTSAAMAITALLGYMTWPVLVAQLCVCLASVVIYRRHCMPNSNIPGPFIASFTRLWHAYHLLVGDFNIKLLELHAKHGDYFATYIILCLPPFTMLTIRQQDHSCALPPMRLVSVIQMPLKKSFSHL